MDDLSAESQTADAFERALAELPQMIQKTEAAGQLLQAGRDEAAFQGIIDITEYLQRFLSYLERWSPPKGKESEKRRAAESIFGTLQALLSAWQASDYVSVADQLLFELVPHLEKNAAWLRKHGAGGSH